jgi:hypothetical protein
MHWSGDYERSEHLSTNMTVRLGPRSWSLSALNFTVSCDLVCTTTWKFAAQNLTWLLVMFHVWLVLQVFSCQLFIVPDKYAFAPSLWYATGEEPFYSCLLTVTVRKREKTKINPRLGLRLRSRFPSSFRAVTVANSLQLQYWGPRSVHDAES